LFQSLGAGPIDYLVFLTQGHDARVSRSVGF